VTVFLLLYLGVAIAILTVGYENLAADTRRLTHPAEPDYEIAYRDTLQPAARDYYEGTQR
jgi:hypothetical protein